ncbi:hypothetical protein DFH06DRAFT_1475444 [Mycena polygramma]|nr:hypothetical protein DFH06DRAFT_1475444 [Mycena polygramma]
MSSMPLPPTSYNVSVYLQPLGTAENQIDVRLDVTNDPDYEEIVRAVKLILYRLASSPHAVASAFAILLGVFLHDKRAEAIFASRNGPDAVPEREQIIEFYTTSPPDFIICETEDHEDGAIRWGRGERGSSELAARNEVFISKELCDAIIAKLDMEDQQARMLRNFHRALLLVVLSHETIDALVNQTFSPLIPTPPEATLCLCIKDSNGDGDPGGCFENCYFKFELVAELPKGLEKGDRLWTIAALLADNEDGLYTLSDDAIEYLIQSFATNKRYQLDTKAPLAPSEAQGTVRWKHKSLHTS